jgi:hypothetical protein
VQPADVLYEVREFFAELRRVGAHLGRDPEFSALEDILTLGGKAHLEVLRENLDRFIFGRGMNVLETLETRAGEMKQALVAQAFVQFRDAITELFAGQFRCYAPDRFPSRFFPQSEMVREMLRLLSEGRADDTSAYIDRNIEQLEGFFFTILGESLRNARMRGSELTCQALIVIGRHVAGARLKRGLPCSFASLWQI